jgi:hypothetical protein
MWVRPIIRTKLQDNTMTTLANMIDDLSRQLPELLHPQADAQVARSFSRAFYALYTEMRVGPDDALPASIQAFLQQTAPDMRSGLLPLDRYLYSRMDALLGTIWKSDEWLGLCQLRSTREALRELYASYLPIGDIMPADHELDAAIRDKGNREAVQDANLTPTRFPASHWWWGMS